MQQVTPFEWGMLAQAIARECWQLRVARECARAYRKAAVEAIRRDDPTWTRNYRAEAARAWSYVARHRAELTRLRAKRAAASPSRTRRAA